MFGCDSGAGCGRPAPPVPRGLRRRRRGPRRRRPAPRPGRRCGSRGAAAGGGAAATRRRGARGGQPVPARCAPPAARAAGASPPAGGAVRRSWRRRCPGRAQHRAAGPSARTAPRHRIARLSCACDASLLRRRLAPLRSVAERRAAREHSSICPACPTCASRPRRNARRRRASIAAANRSSVRPVLCTAQFDGGAAAAPGDVKTWPGSPPAAPLRAATSCWSTSPCRAAAATAPSPGACSTACSRKAGSRSRPPPAPPPAR